MFEQGGSKQGVTIFAWRPGSQHNVAATRGADKVLASDCLTQFGRPEDMERMSHLCDGTVDGPTARRDNVLASKCEYPLSVTPLLNVPYVQEICCTLSGIGCNDFKTYAIAMGKLVYIQLKLFY